MTNVNEIASTSFSDEVLKSSLPVMVDFYAPWCGPCKMMAPLLDTLAGEFKDRVKVVKVNVDDAADLAAQYRITGVPTLILFKSGEPVDTTVGAPSPKDLRSKFEGAVAGK